MPKLFKKVKSKKRDDDLSSGDGRFKELIEKLSKSNKRSSRKKSSLANADERIPSLDDLNVMIDIELPLKNLLVFQNIGNLPDVIKNRIIMLNRIVTQHGACFALYNENGSINIGAVLRFLVSESNVHGKVIGAEVIEMILDKVRYPQYYAQCVASEHNFEGGYLAELKQHPTIRYIIDGTDKPNSQAELEKDTVTDISKEAKEGVCYLNNFMAYGPKSIKDIFGISLVDNYRSHTYLALLDGKISQMCDKMKLFTEFGYSTDHQAHLGSNTRKKGDVQKKEVFTIDYFVLFHYLITMSQKHNQVVGYYTLERMTQSQQCMDRINSDFISRHAGKIQLNVCTESVDGGQVESKNIESFYIYYQRVFCENPSGLFVGWANGRKSDRAFASPYPLQDKYANDDIAAAGSLGLSV